MEQSIQLAGVISDSIVDGPGLRLTIFVQGCGHNCCGCHNPETHDPKGGYSMLIDECINRVIAELKANPLLMGVTFSGGEPIDQCDVLLPIAKAVIALGKNLVMFTGYTFEALQAMQNPNALKLAGMCTLLVDGPFVLSERDLTLKFRGSRNQRLLDGIKSVKENIPIEWKSKFDFTY